MSNLPKCPTHGDLRLIPSGVSKTSGKAYAAFWACKERGCTYKPTQGTPTNIQAFEAGLNEDIRNDRIQKLHDDKTENIAKAVALNNAVNLYTQKEFTIDAILAIAASFYNWLRKDE